MKIKKMFDILYYSVIDISSTYAQTALIKQVCLYATSIKIYGFTNIPLVPQN